MALRRGIAASCCLAALLIAAPGLAQAPAPRDIPKDFVLPGPPPTNAPADASEPAGAPAREASPPSVAAPPRTPPAVSGAMVPAPPATIPDAGTTTILGTGGAARHRWPCVQRKVERISAGQVWPGPPLETAADVERTEAMRRLVASLAARRLPVAEAQKMAAEFVTALPENQRARTATAVFADLLALLNAERGVVMRGIERYGARQQALAARLREQNAALSAIRAKGDAARTGEAQEALLWDTRIFEERRRSLTYVCEVPTLIEQRLFALGRAISGAL